VCDELEALGIPLKPDRDQTWHDFVGWRVNYDAVLVGLAVFVMAPPGIWSTDRVRKDHSFFITSRRAARRAAAAAMNGQLPSTAPVPITTAIPSDDAAEPQAAEFG
jgi:hypothetical protein